MLRALSVAALFLTALVPAASASFALDTADTDCIGVACEAINGVCQKAVKTDCVAALDDDADTRCVGTPCEIVNDVCYVVWKASHGKVIRDPPCVL